MTRSRQLTSPHLATTTHGASRFHGAIQLEHKEDLKARGEASPDDGDTLAMTFAVKVAAKARPKYENLVYSFPERLADLDAVTLARFRSIP
jgi:hypothetical protein